MQEEFDEWKKELEEWKKRRVSLGKGLKGFCRSF
jgi:hypothetical protein